MFVFLSGYGLGQLADSRFAKGGDWPSVRKLLRRRGFWLLSIVLADGMRRVGHRGPFEIALRRLSR